MGEEFLWTLTRASLCIYTRELCARSLFQHEICAHPFQFFSLFFYSLMISTKALSVFVHMCACYTHGVLLYALCSLSLPSHSSV